MKTVDIHIDFACPFSYLGGEYFIQFLENNHKNGEVSPNFISFRLNPNKDNLNKDFLKNMMKKFNKSSIAETKAAYKSIESMGMQLGIHYDVEQVVDTNSLMAHRGLQFVKSVGGDQATYFRRAMKAHWEQGLDYSSLDVIVSILDDLGYDATEFRTNPEAFDVGVKTDVSLAQKRHVNSVPTFIANKHRVSGVGSPSDYRKLVD